MATSETQTTPEGSPKVLTPRRYVAEEPLLDFLSGDDPPPGDDAAPARPSPRHSVYLDALDDGAESETPLSAPRITFSDEVRF